MVEITNKIDGTNAFQLPKDTAERTPFWIRTLYEAEQLFIHQQDIPKTKELLLEKATLIHQKSKELTIVCHDHHNVEKAYKNRLKHSGTSSDFDSIRKKFNAGAATIKNLVEELNFLAIEYVEVRENLAITVDGKCTSEFTTERTGIPIHLLATA